MEVVSLCPLPVGSLVWQPRPGTTVLTFVCKATFMLWPGELALAPEHEPINEADRPWSNEVESLYATTDLAPWKPRADVMLVGNAYAPGDHPVRSLRARLAVAEIDKTLEVACDRTLEADGSVHDGPPFSRMPLLYERSAGGPGTSNPLGMSLDARNGYGAVALPNLLPPGVRIGPGNVEIEPVGFGPLTASSPLRRAKLGRHADTWSLERWHESPMPPGVDMAYFNGAPVDQRPAALRGDERVILENLHPEHPRLTMQLPGLRLSAVVERAGTMKPVPMVCDTLWIDTARGVCTLTYRGKVPLSSATEAGWVVVALDADDAGQPRNEPHRSAPAAKEVERDPEENTQSIAFDAISAPPTSPDEHPRTRESQASFHGEEFTATGREMVMRRDGAVLPFRLASPEPSDTGTRAMPARSAAALPAPRDDRASRPDAVLPFAPAPEPPRRDDRSSRSDAALPFRPVPPPAPSSTGLSWTPVPPAPAAPPPPAPIPALPPPVQVSAPSLPAPIPPPVRPQVKESPWATPGGLNAPAASSSAAPLPIIAASSLSAGPAGEFRSGGALEASNAAAVVAAEARGKSLTAEPAPRPIVTKEPPPRPAPPKEPADAVDLVFFEEASLPRIRRVPPWKKILDALDDRPLDSEDDDPAAAKDPAVVEDRREIVELLVKAEPSDSPAVHDALSRGVRESGHFFAPILMVAGELQLPFDEIESLKATMTTVTPLAGTDENLRASIEVAREFLALPGLSSSPAVAEGLTTRIRDAFNSGKRAVPPGYLDVQTERALLEQRAYQRRSVLGARRLRALFHFASGGPGPVVTYLPDAIAPKLPMYQRFKARMIVRVHLPIDQYESGALAFEGLALARLVPPPKKPA